MKIKLLVFFITINLSSNFLFGQNKKELIKYTYLLIGIKNQVNNTATIYPIGSCFFIRNNGRLFLITAKHCLNGFNTFNLNKTNGKVFDTIGFRYYNTELKQYLYTSLSLRDVKQSFVNDYFFNKPDAEVLEYKDTSFT